MKKVIAIGAKLRFKLWPFYCFIGLKMANIVPFGLKIGLPINLDLNDGQNKYKFFKVLAQNRPNATWAQGL